MQTGLFDRLFALYGDSAYPIMQCLLSRHELAAGGALTPNQITENDCMSSVRESIEWVNADIKNKFAFTTYPKQFKLMKKKSFGEKNHNCCVYSYQLLQVFEWLSNSAAFWSHAT
jgi:hypothetical protein